MLALHLSSSVCAHLQPQSEMRSWIRRTLRVATSTLWEQSPEMLRGGMLRPQLPTTWGSRTTSKEAAWLQTKGNGSWCVEDIQLPWPTSLADRDLHRASHWFPDSFTNNKPFKMNQTSYWTFPVVGGAPFSGERAGRKQPWVRRRHPLHRGTLC